MGEKPGLPRWVRCNHKGPNKRKAGQSERGGGNAVMGMERGVMQPRAGGCWWPFEPGKQGTDWPLEPPEGPSPVNTLILALKTHF